MITHIVPLVVKTSVCIAVNGGMKDWKNVVALVVPRPNRHMSLTLILKRWTDKDEEWETIATPLPSIRPCSETFFIIPLPEHGP